MCHWAERLEKIRGTQINLHPYFNFNYSISIIYYLAHPINFTSKYLMKFVSRFAGNVGAVGLTVHRAAPNPDFTLTKINKQIKFDLTNKKWLLCLIAVCVCF